MAASDIQPDRRPDCDESNHMPFMRQRKGARCMGRAQSVWAIALTKEQEHHKVLDRILSKPVITLADRREEQQARLESNSATRLAKHRGDVINMLTGDVMDTRHIADKTAAANLPTRIFDFPLDAA
jgi:hypothetical protein